MAKYTYASIQNLETENFYAKLEEDYIITNKRITLMIYKKHGSIFEKKRVFGTYIKIPFKVIPNRVVEEKKWKDARSKLHNLALTKLKELEIEFSEK